MIRCAQKTAGTHDQLSSWHWSSPKVISQPMTALAHTSESDCRTRTTSEHYTANESWTRTKYNYDSLNRLATYADTATGQPCKGLSWTYDAWGNRTDQTVTAGTCNTFHQTVNTQNRLVGPPYQYDAAGNMTQDVSHTYSYDAENRIISVDGGSAATYGYNASGQRIRKTVGTNNYEYVYDLVGRVVAEWYVTPTFNAWGRGYVYLGDRVLAQYSGGTTYFMHADHLGSNRLLTKLDKSVYDSIDYLPYGEQVGAAQKMLMRVFDFGLEAPA